MLTVFRKRVGRLTGLTILQIHHVILWRSGWHCLWTVRWRHVFLSRIVAQSNSQQQTEFGDERCAYAFIVNTLSASTPNSRCSGSCNSASGGVIDRRNRADIDESLDNRACQQSAQPRMRGHCRNICTSLGNTYCLHLQAWLCEQWHQWLEFLTSSNGVMQPSFALKSHRDADFARIYRSRCQTVHETLCVQIAVCGMF